jgi:CRISPR-associated protein Csm4
MELLCTHWQPIKAFHFGQRGVGIEASGDYAPSDTLFSALCHVLRHIYGVAGLESFLEAYAVGSPPFLVGGGFPYCMVAGKALRFYPAPMSFKRADNVLRQRLQKATKARWISESLFSEYAKQGNIQSSVEYFPAMGAAVTADERDQIKQAYGRVLNREQGEIQLWVVDDVPRVALDRISNASNIYRAGRLTFAENGGLWVGFQVLDEQWRGVLSALLNVLADEGIGGERSSGYGQFMLALDDDRLSFPDAVETDRFVTLSHCRPASTQEATQTLSGNAAYGLDVRRGWMGSLDASGLRRKAVRMLTMGSVLQSIRGQSLYGSLANVTPDVFKRHPVYRYGFALPIGVEGSHG